MNVQKIIARDGLIVLLSISVLVLCHYAINKLDPIISRENELRDYKIEHFDEYYSLFSSVKDKEEREECEKFANAQRVKGINPPIPEGHPCREVNRKSHEIYMEIWLSRPAKLENAARNVLRGIQIFFLWGLPLFFGVRFIIWAIKTLRAK